MVFKELICNTFYFGQVWCSPKNSVQSFYFGNSVLTVSTLGGCGSLQRTDLLTVSSLGRRGVFKELICNTFYFGRVLWPSKT